MSHLGSFCCGFWIFAALHAASFATRKLQRRKRCKNAKTLCKNILSNAEMGVNMNKVKLFEEKIVRSTWDEKAEKWWFSITDVIAILTDQSDYEKSRNYWKWLKNKLKEEGSEVVSIANQLKMLAPDKKMRLTDVADTEQILRLVQSIPSKKAEPFKLWLAKVGSERLDETIDPEISIERAINSYRHLGYSESWINQRIKSIEVRKVLMNGIKAE